MLGDAASLRGRAAWKSPASPIRQPPRGGAPGSASLATALPAPRARAIAGGSPGPARRSHWSLVCRLGGWPRPCVKLQRGGVAPTWAGGRVLQPLLLLPPPVSPPSPTHPPAWPSRVPGSPRRPAGRFLLRGTSSMRQDSALASSAVLNLRHTAPRPEPSKVRQLLGRSQAGKYSEIHYSNSPLPQNSSYNGTAR